MMENNNFTLLFDAGFGCGGDLLVNNLERELSGRNLDYIVLSHSHYDHAPGSAWCTNRWPDCRVIASYKAKNVFSRPGARATMRKLDHEASVKYGIISKDDLFDSLRVDIPLDDTEIFFIGDIPIQMLYFPGHTNCSTGIYFPDSAFLLSSETLGIYCGGDQIPFAYMTGFQKGLNSISRARSLPLRHMLIPHTGIIHGKDCMIFLEKAEKCVHRVYQALTNGIDNGLSKPELMQLLKKLTYTPYLEAIQPEAAFDLNAGYIIDCILREYPVGKEM